MPKPIQMIQNEVYLLIENMGNAARINRQKAADYILHHPESFESLLLLAFDVKYKRHFKAAWVLEFVLEQKIHWLYPHLDYFCENIHRFKHESAIRPMAKIVYWVAVRYINKKDLTLNNLLNINHINLIIETGFDWMIQNIKVAPKVYTMRTLYNLGKIKDRDLDWVHGELKQIILQQISSGSPAYQSIGKRILKKIY